MLQSKRFTADLFIKLYNTEDLLDPGWEARVEVIERLSSSHELIPLTSFELCDGGQLCYRQQRLKRMQPDLASLPAYLKRLAEELECLTDTAFIHGDINFKNLLFDGTDYRLIDLEPSLRQRRKGRKTLMYTPPYIALGDFQYDHLTTSTDKVGFYFFCRRLLNPIAQFSPLFEMQRIASGHSIVERFAGISEDVFNSLNYSSILNLLLDL